MVKYGNLAEKLWTINKKTDNSFKMKEYNTNLNMNAGLIKKYIFYCTGLKNKIENNSA